MAGGGGAPDGGAVVSVVAAGAAAALLVGAVTLSNPGMDDNYNLKNPNQNTCIK